MPREKPIYRDTLDRLDAAFPGKELLQKKELAAFLGVSLQTVERRMGEVYNEKMKRYPKTKVARFISE